jgi:ankyrin repeat protein
MLLEAGANIESKTSNQETPLQVAMLECNDAASRLLIKQGANCTQRCDDQQVALHVACEQHIPATVELLLEKDFSPHDVDALQRTPLFYCRSAATANRLVANEANINHTDMNGFTPLHYSISTENRPMTRFLLEAGAELNVRPKSDGLTELQRAEDLGDEELVELIEDEMHVRRRTQSYRDVREEGFEVISREQAVE